MQAEADEKFEKMTKEPVEKLICFLAVPTIIGMLITTIYNTADTYFVGKISTTAIAAVGVVYSFMSIVQAFGFLYGHGSGNYMSKVLGERKRNEAENMAGMGLIFSLCTGVIIAVITFIFADQTAMILGGNENIKNDVVSYLRMIALGIPFIMAGLTLNNQFRFQGNALYGMMGIALGGVLNIILDPVFIFGFNLGVMGAGLSTSLSQFISFIFLLYLDKRCGNVKHKIRGIKYSAKLIKLLYFGGMPNFARQAIASVAVILLNNAAIAYGETAVASFTVVNRITMLVGASMIGFGQGFQPVCGYNYGAKLYARVKKAYSFSVKISTIFFLVMTVLCFLLAGNIIGAFSSDSAVISLGSTILKYQCISVSLMGWIIMSGMLLQNIGLFKQAVIVSAARQGIFFLPLILILPYFFGLYGIILVQPLSDIGTFLISLPMGIKAIRNLSGV